MPINELLPTMKTKLTEDQLMKELEAKMADETGDVDMSFIKEEEVHDLIDANTFLEQLP